MALTKIQLEPGVNAMRTPLANMGGVSAANLVRWRQGLPEKMRGWQSVAYTGAPMHGAVRSVLPFYELAGDVLLGYGSHTHLYVSKGGVLYDLTPVLGIVAVNAGGIVTTNASATVAVTTAGAHGLSVGDFFTFDTIVGQARTASGITVGGIALSGDYVVAASGSSTTLTFVAATVATSGAASAGAASLQPYLGIGADTATPGLGWGAGGWGIAGWGLPGAQPANLLQPRFWSLDSFGEWLLAVPSRGRLYVFKPDVSGAVSTRAVEVINATPALGPPLTIGGMLVGMPERHIMLFGCSGLNVTTAYDPLLVRWSDVESIDSFQATAINTAGSFRLQGGSRIVGWLNTTQQTLIWTDLGLWVCRFLGSPYVYGFSKVEGSSGLIGQNARCEMGGGVYWMGPSGFWGFLGGTPQALVSPLQDLVFGTASDPASGMEASQQSKVVCATNTLNGEITWFYPAKGSTENNRYVTFNVRENCWYAGTMARTAWADRSILANPVGVAPGPVVYNHEIGTDADGLAMGESMSTGFFDLAEGEQLLFISQLVPDFQNLTGSLQITVRYCEWPNGPVGTKGPYTVTSSTKYIPVRARARQMALDFAGGAAGSHWRLGALRANVQSDGLQ